MDSEDWACAPGSALVDLYVRLRDETDRGRYTADPNDQFRASIAMAILEASQSTTPDLLDLEACVRRRLAAPLRENAAPKSVSIVIDLPTAAPPLLGMSQARAAVPAPANAAQASVG